MKYDLDLFAKLNEEYRHRPIVDTTALATRRRMLSPSERDRDAPSRDERLRYAARSQLNPILADIDLKDRTVLELGCGHGHLTASLLETAGAASAVGVDVQRYSSWDEHLDPRLTLMVADLSVQPVFSAGSFDVVVSHVAFEHVTRPVQMLEALHGLLKDGGTAWLRMNLYTSRTASHLYRQICFPWPHLLFEDDVVEEFYRKRHSIPSMRCAWVNKMTVAHYLFMGRELGFTIRRVRRKSSPIDVPFYVRFSDKLGRYQALDLETDFLTLVLVKGNSVPEESAEAMAGLSYVKRQQALDKAVARHFVELASVDPELGGHDLDRDPGSFQQPWEGDQQIGSGVGALPGSLDNQTATPQRLRAHRIEDERPLPRLEPVPGFPERSWRAYAGKKHDPLRQREILTYPWDGRVLEVGSGRGYVACLLALRHRPRVLIGLEPQRTWRDQSRDLARHNGVDQFIAVAGTGEQLPFPDRSFDRVLISEVLEHVRHPLPLVKEAYRVLTPGGTGLVSVPGHGKMPPGTVDGHVQDYTIDEVKELIAAANLRLLEHRTVSLWEFYFVQRWDDPAESDGGATEEGAG